MADNLTRVSANTPLGQDTSRPVLGLRELFAASIGVIVSQVGIVSVLQGIGLGGWGFVLASAIAFSMAIANTMAYAEMALMIPTAGGLGAYAEAAIGNFPAILLVFAGYITPAIFGVPAELILLNEVVNQAIPTSLPPFFWPVAIIVVCAVLNIFGADVFAKVQTLLSFLVLTFLAVCGAVALSGHAASPEPTAGIAAMSHNTTTLSVVALAFWALMGSEFVTPLIPEARNPNRDLPRAMVGGLIAIFCAELVFAVGAAVVVPRDHLVTSGSPHLEYALAVAGPGIRSAFAWLAIVATASLVNTVLAGIPRMLCGMAEQGQVFPVLKRLHPRFGTPVAGIVFVALLPLIGLVWSRGSVENILPLTIAASVAWLLAYIMAQVSLIVLRVRHPRAVRPFRSKGFPIVPAAAIAGMFYVVVNSSPEPALTSRIVEYTGIVLGLFALVGGTWVRFVMKRGLFEPVIPEALKEAS